MNRAVAYCQRLLAAFGIASMLATQPALAAAPTRVAVLPFSTPKDKPDLEQYGVGMMDTLITALTNVPEFVVLDRANMDRVLKEQAFQQSGLVDPATTVKLGKLLAAQELVGGSLTTALAKIRIVGTFTDVASGKIQKAQQVTGDIKDIFDLQDQLAQQFLTNRQVAVTPQVKRQLAAVLRSTSNLTAYQAYLKGRQSYLLFTTIGFHDAIRLYKQALATDPKYALALAAEADAYLHWAFQKQQNGGQFEKDYRTAYELAKQAIGINPDLAMAYRIMGAASYRVRDVDASERQRLARRAVELTPTDAEAWYELWKGTGNEGDPDHEYIRKTLELDPNLVGAIVDRGASLLNRGRVDEGLAAFRHALQLSPENPYIHNDLALAYSAKKQFTEALAACREAVRLDPDYANAYNTMGVALYGLGRKDDAMVAYDKAVQIYQQIIKFNPSNALLYYEMAIPLVHRARIREAVDALQTALKLEPDLVPARQLLDWIMEQLKQ